MRRYSFRPKHRLLHQRDFARVLDQVDRRVSRGPLIILARKNMLTHPRLGLAIRKKTLRNAVDRNTLKRVAREQFRVRQHRLENLDLVFMNRAGCEGTSRKQLNRIVASAFEALTTDET